MDITDADIGGRWLKVTGRENREGRVPLDADVALVIQLYLLAKRLETPSPRLFVMAKRMHLPNVRGMTGVGAVVSRADRSFL